MLIKITCNNMRYAVLTFFCSCLRKGTSPFFLTSSVCTIWSFHCVSHLEDACQSKEQKWTLNIDHYSPAPHQQWNRPDIHLMSTVILCNSHKKHSSEKKNSMGVLLWVYGVLTLAVLWDIVWANPELPSAQCSNVSKKEHVREREVQREEVKRQQFYRTSTP